MDVQATAKVSNRLFMLLFAVLLIIMLYNAFGERVYHNNGNGWDGAVYTDMVKKMPEVIYNNTISSFYYQRILPSFLCYASLRVVGVETSDINVLHFFIVFNIILILISVFVYTRIAKLLSFNSYTFIAGFVLLFYNFSVLKMSMYDPVKTDYLAFLEGLLISYFYLKKNFIALLITAICSLFTFPTVIFLSSIFLILFDKDVKATMSDIKPAVIKYLLPLLLASIPVLLTFYSYKYNFVKFDFARATDGATMSWVDTKERLSMLLSIIMLVFVLFVFYKAMILYVKDILNFRGFTYYKAGVMVLIFIVANVLIKKLCDVNAPNPNSFADFLYRICYQALVYPLGSYIAHFIYFGSVIILLFLRFKKVISSIGNLGKGFVVFLGLNLILMIGSESRQFIYVIPFITVAILYAMNEELNGNKLLLFVLIIINLTFSFFWYQINLPDVQMEVGSQKAFPQQRYFGFQGPWVSRNTYYIHLLFTIACFAATKYVLDRRNVRRLL